MSRETGLCEKENVVRRHPRKWLVVWTYGQPDLRVKESLEKDVKPHHPELLEVFVPMVEVTTVDPRTRKSVKKQQPAAQGYIYLRVVEPKFLFLEAVRRVRGVGGFVAQNDQEALRGMASWDIQKMLQLDKKKIEVPTEKIEKGDFVEVCSGPLENSRGRVLHVGEERVRVEISILSRMVPLELELYEVSLLEKAIL